MAKINIYNECLIKFLTCISDKRQPHKKILTMSELISPSPRQLFVLISKKEFEDFTEYGYNEWFEKKLSEFLERMPFRIERYVELSLPKRVSFTSRQQYNNVSMRVILDYKPGSDEEYLNFDILFVEG